MSAPPFSQNTPNKIGKGIEVSGKNTLIKTDDDSFRVAIADELIDAKVDGKKMFCVHVENAGVTSYMMFGVTPMETFDSTKEAYFGSKDFTGCGMRLYSGGLFYPVEKYHDIIDGKITHKATEFIVILTISNNGEKKEIRFLCDGNESKSSDVSEHLKGYVLFPAICLWDKDQQITTISIDEIKTRTPEIKNLIKEYQQQKNKNNDHPPCDRRTARPSRADREQEELRRRLRSSKDSPRPPRSARRTCPRLR